MQTSDIRIPTEIAETLVDPKAYADHRIHDAHRWLRANNPVGMAELKGFDPFWVVTSYADVQHVSRNNSLFHSGDRATTIIDQANDRMNREVTGGSPHLIRSLVQIDAPDHPKLRAITQSWFMPPNLKKREEHIREIAQATVRKMLSGGERCDFVQDVALHYPLHVVMEVLGVPEADEPLMLKLTQEIFGSQDPDSARKIEVDPDAAEARLSLALQQTIKEFGDYFYALAADRRANPREDLISLVANAKIDGQPLDPLDELGYYIIVAAAGHDTTSSTTAGALWALCENPDIFEKVRNDPALIPAFIEEGLRWTTPVKTFMRTATADTELGGRKIAKGDWLMLCYASANRDEAVFEDPYRFRIDRAGAAKHLAFGHGGHVCLGQHLARMEMRILFEELLPRLKAVAFDGTPTMSQACFVNGPKSLPIRYERA